MPNSRQFCTFYLGEHLFGLDVLCVQEVVRLQPITRVPLAHRVVQGLINLRGQIVTALDLRRRLDLPDREEQGEPVNVVVQTDDGPVSLLVDGIGDVLEISDEQFEPPPETLRGPVSEAIKGAYKLPDTLLTILDVRKIVALPAS